MQISVNGNMAIGSALPKYVEDKLLSEVGKLFDSATNANVFFRKSGALFHTNIIINEGSKRGVLIKSDAEADDVYYAFDMALAKVLKQLRKYKGKLQNYRKKSLEMKAQNSDMPYILADRWILEEGKKAEIMEEEAMEEKLYNVVEEKEAELSEMTIDEALMHMDLIGLPAFMFINAENGLINVVYRRSDGNISWINPKQ